MDAHIACSIMHAHISCAPSTKYVAYVEVCMVAVKSEHKVARGVGHEERAAPTVDVQTDTIVVVPHSKIALVAGTADIQHGELTVKVEYRPSAGGDYFERRRPGTEAR
ncbi:hypothetical protein ACLQ2Q_11470 [Microbacterium sp. DT81.1]|uniref:hypothetical protein n=1 Tax=Microbacterium sp. DT81.1 TaxID=3393413 RepID=UPI003CF3EDBD